MCGIAGFVTVAPHSGEPAVLHSMTAAIAHRGPDDSGTFSDAHASLGHRRLSIIDLATGSQPMFNEDGSLCIVYNGEIFNHAAIRPELEKAGHQYRSRSDTETLLHAFEQEGFSCLDHFRGMFAFAIWDRKNRVLSCARDRLGIKPFYYFWDGRVFVFASEIKALLKHPGVPRRFEESALPEYLAFGYANGDQTLFAGIRKLMPGHVLTLDLNSPRPEPSIERYWDIPARSGPCDTRPAPEWISECRSRVEETVRMRLMSDVPLGMFLSGGVDSSAIAALVAKYAPARLNTFSVGYAEQAYSELPYARRVADWIGSNHHEVTVSCREFFDTLPSLIWHEDEPIAWPSSVSLYFVSRLAAKQVKVVLTGEGGDELFAGYHRYRTYLLNRRLAAAYRFAPRALRESIRRRLASTSLLSAPLRRKLGHTILGREADLESLYLENFCTAFSRAELDALLLSPEGSGGALFRYLGYWNATGGSKLAQLLYADQKTYLVELLMKQDQMSMACSIESRVPFLDHHFVEFAATVPDRLKIHGGSGKYILKKAVEDLLPHDIVWRRKMGFPTPIRKWLLDPEIQPRLEALAGPNTFLAHYLDPAAVSRLVDDHRRGVRDNTDRLWRLLNLKIWADRVLRPAGEAAANHA